MTLVIIMREIAKYFFGAFAFSVLLATSVFAQSSTPLLKVITPTEGQTLYENRVPILFSIENFQLTDYQTNQLPRVGQGHIHLWLDEASPTRESAVKLIKDDFTFSDVSYGDHNLRAELVNNDHSSLNPPVVVSVNFKNEPVGSPSPVSASSFDKNTALVILVVVALVIIAAWWYTKEEEEGPVKPESKSKAQSRKSTTKRKRRKKK
ncbi:MAG: hypothetical protein UU05_C0029G0001 [Candidatus Curtissbacteria bacterium GW2011_GWA1_40_47]|nr:MAG: hypothetical protein UU00_C0037G0006 [Microgenomates group bacterium GW2011_GWC1_40_35]KKR65059.1 MAG: hypothetical protein UU05_C0029G0001 [Candidatus Curtissbacteria bacterium GW2011_GWA1_40_47]KKS02088.1 MAG: hypothetical protein UU53_C0004G0036 [Candidatus Curtissbacteria bacterium GW2011_GWC2_41_21]